MAMPQTRAGRLLLGKNAGGDPVHTEWLLNDILAIEREALALGASTVADLDDRHIVEFTATDYGLQHPLACRPNLIDCEYNRRLASAGEPAMEPGRYVMTIDPDGDEAYWLLRAEVAPSELGATSPRRRRRSRRGASGRYDASRSIPMQRRPVATAATAVVPLPRNGSRHIPPGGVTSRTRCAMSSIGLIVGWWLREARVVASMARALRCRLGVHAWEPVVRSPDGVVERQNCRRRGCGTGRVLVDGVEVNRGRRWWYDIHVPPGWRRP